MTSNDEAAVEAIVAGMQPAHTMHGFAINILAAIRDGKVPGIALKTHDGTTCWQCEKCGKTRTGTGCMVCLERECDALAGLLERSVALLRAIGAGKPYTVASGNPENRTTLSAVIEDIDAALGREGEE